MRKGKVKKVKENGGFMRVEEENETEISEESRKKSWSSSIQKIKETYSRGKMGVTSRTNSKLGQDVIVKDHKINNVASQTDNKIMIYNEITNEIYINKQEKIKPNSSSNHNTDKHVAKLKQ